MICIGLFHALVVIKIRYAIPTWGGFLSAHVVGEINGFLKNVLTDTALSWMLLLLSQPIAHFSKAYAYTPTIVNISFSPSPC